MAAQRHTRDGLSLTPLALVHSEDTRLPERIIFFSLTAVFKNMHVLIWSGCCFQWLGGLLALFSFRKNTKCQMLHEQFSCILWIMRKFGLYKFSIYGQLRNFCWDILQFPSSQTFMHKTIPLLSEGQGTLAPTSADMGPLTCHCLQIEEEATRPSWRNKIFFRHPVPEALPSRPFLTRP